MLLFFKFSFTATFLVKNAKINVFEEKSFLMKMFYQIKQTGHLKKHQTFATFRMTDILMKMFYQIKQAGHLKKHQTFATFRT